jgi:hypothetical protein
MKFYVTYCITHPERSPMTATCMVEARTRQELEVRLARGVGKWKNQGYAIEIVKVTCFELLSLQSETRSNQAAGQL